MPADFLGRLRQLGAGLQALGCFDEFGFECSQLRGEVGCLFGEQIGADPGAVEIEQLATPLREVLSECVGPARPSAGYRPGRLLRLCPDRLLESVAVSKLLIKTRKWPRHGKQRPARRETTRLTAYG